MSTFIKSVFVFAVLAFILPSCKKDIGNEAETQFRTVNEYTYNVVQEWNTIWMETERYASGYRPCPAASALGYVGLAAYESCVDGMPEYQSIASRYNGLNIPKSFANQEYHWPTVVNAVNYYFYQRLFPSVTEDLKNNFKALNDKNNKAAVASAVWEWMKTDAVSFDGYKDPFKNNNWEERLNEAGAWQPTIPGPGEGMFPYWGKARALAIREDQKLCKPYTSYVGEYSEKPNSGLYAQAVEVMAQNTPSLSYQTEWVGEFWSDDLLGLTFSPPSRWIAIANQVYENENASLEEAILANVRIGLALHDAAIGCWNSKYYYNLQRPETYIKRLIDPTWEPNLENPNTGDKGISPSFPAYPSGHATFGAASAEVLASVFGYSYGMTDNCHRNRTEFEGYPRTFSSFYEMALENAWSRVPLGVHFRMDAEEGMRYGTEIGRTVNKLPWKK